MNERNRAIADVIQHAYNAGLMQYDGFQVAGIQVYMRMFKQFNSLEFRYHGRFISISMYDSDSEDTQLSSILDIVNELAH